ncbi:cation diffusion facilitator family transporter [Geminicoccus roseus]|uniref:cation diffusion facilitator family transporter n=1 Tax=Geminicoccus roseus TaxID=404900 RepID=UPI0004038540|nr:cation diffusion facilitator family transporter [Geminicoccus roseus]
MGAGHHHHHPGAESGDRRVLWAVAINLLLTLAQIVGGILAGSLALVADAIHNLSDAISIGIGYIARRIARRPANEAMTFGYVRAEIVAALINYTTLIVIGVYLVYEAVMRFIEPKPVTGWLVVVVGGIAFVVDLATAVLTYALSKESMNIRAVFLHNVADTLGSVGVIAAGTLVLLYDWQIADPIITLLIAAYVLWQAFREIGGSIRMLMLSTPPGIDVLALVGAMREAEGVADVHHVHVFALDEQENALEAHVVLEDGADAEAVKCSLRERLRDGFGVGHTTLELESRATCRRNGETETIGHRIGAAPRGRPR